MGRPTDRDSPFSGIDPRQLHDFINSVDRHTNDGGNASAGPLVRNWMSQAARIGLDTAALSKVTKHLAWAQDQLPMLRQRLFLAQRADQPYPGSPHMVEIDDGAVDSATPAEIRRDAAEAVKLAETDPGEMSNDQLTRLNLLLELHDNNPYFAEQFATGLGPAATVKFYATLTDPRQFEVNPRSGSTLSPELKQREKLLGTLENSLGSTLATASTGDNAAMRHWQKTMISLGGKDLGDGGQYHVYGFQVMSDLMRHGSYGTAFLKHFGTALVTFEKTNTTDVVGGLQRRVVQKNALPWEQPGMNLVRLHYGAGNDGGADPMTGYMEALGHNSAASTAFFKDPKNFDYLTQTRAWPQDYAADDAKTIAGYKSLGHALESATMGSPYDADPPGLHRTKDTAAVMTEIVNRYGQPATGTDTTKTGPSGADLLARQEGIAPSLGRLTAAYIDDVDWGLTGDDTLNVFADDNGGRLRGDRAMLQATNLERFLGTIGHDDDAYRIVTNAQQAYSTSILTVHPPTLDSNGQVVSTNTEAVARVGGKLQGIMDRAWVDQYKADGEAEDTNFNDSVDKRAERQQMIAGLITGGVFAFAPGPESGIGATIVPLATDDIHDQMDSQIEQNIGAYSDSQHRNLADVRQGKASEVFAAGREASWTPAYQLVHGNELHGWTDAQRRRLDETLRSAQEDGYTSGSLTQEQGGNLPVPN